MGFGIAFGFVVVLAAMLVVQAVLYTWVVAQSGRTLQGQSPGRFAQTVALDLRNALELGLSIVKAIVERHGGHLSVDSRPGRTVFQVTIKFKK